LEQTFDDWKSTDPWEVQFHDCASLDEMIAYWREERAIGDGYYGDENESAHVPP